MQYVFDFWNWRTRKLEKSFSLTAAIEKSVCFFRSFNASSETPSRTSSAPGGNIFSVNKGTTQPYKASNCKCRFCGLKERPGTLCLARRTCLKCGKQGRWAAKYKSTVAIVASDQNEEVASVLSSVKTLNEVRKYSNGIFEKTLNGKHCSLCV